jgi:hypothetical protein
MKSEYVREIEFCRKNIFMIGKAIDLRTSIFYYCKFLGHLRIIGPLRKCSVLLVTLAARCALSQRNRII